MLPLPRPRHKPLRERSIYAVIAASFSGARPAATMSGTAARTTYATTGIAEETPLPPPPPVTPVVTPVVTTDVPRVALETEEPRRKRGERAERVSEEGEERAEEVAPVVSTFILSYTLLLALTAFGLAIAGGATNFWVVVRCVRVCVCVCVCVCLLCKREGCDARCHVGSSDVRAPWAWALRRIRAARLRMHAARSASQLRPPIPAPAHAHAQRAHC